jgi:hypothetical protein
MMSFLRGETSPYRGRPATINEDEESGGEREREHLERRHDLDIAQIAIAILVEEVEEESDVRVAELLWWRL